VSRLAGFPTGLLSLVGSQNFGSAPKDLGDVVQPTLDLSELYLLSQLVPFSGTLTAPANGANSAQGGIAVPNGEVWYVQQVGLQVLTGVGVTGEFTLYATPAPGGGFTPLADTQVMTASTFRMKAGVQGPMWLRSGAEISCHIANLVGVPVVSIAALVCRLKS